MKRLPCVLAVAGALAGAPLAVSACSTLSPIQTSASYNPSDGVPATSGPISARNLLVVAEQEGGPGTLSGSLLNTSDSPAQVSFQTREESESRAAPTAAITLRGREQRQITGVTFAAIDSPPGELTTIYLITSAGKTLVTVPVFRPEGYFATLRPTAGTSASGSPGPATAPAGTAPSGAGPGAATSRPASTAPTTPSSRPATTAPGG